jgi:tryptophan-rich sensory protein
MEINNFFKLAIAIIVCELAGIIGSVFTISSVSGGWYAGLAKPELTPPSWVFGPAWTTLFALMGISFFLVWKKHSHILKNVRMLRVWMRGISFFVLQLVLNALWSIIFGLHNPGAAFIEIIFLWLVIVLTIVVFYRVSRPAAYLLLPYILWVSFAGYLNYFIWQSSASMAKQVPCTMEAKLCPDGSYVGRVGPDCEFALCPPAGFE